MPTLELTDAQVRNVVEQLSPEHRRRILRESVSETPESGPPPRAVGTAGLESRFHALARQWKEETPFLSSVTEMATHPAYQQVIGMGEAVLPLIFAELRREPDHWFWALQAITGENPVPPADRGNLRRMADAWLTWATEHGY